MSAVSSIFCCIILRMLVTYVSVKDVKRYIRVELVYINSIQRLRYNYIQSFSSRNTVLEATHIRHIFYIVCMYIDTADRLTVTHGDNNYPFTRRALL